MSLSERGFLSPDIAHWIKKHRAENQRWFALAEDLNSVACAMLPKVSVLPEDRQAFLVATLFMRGLEFYQGAILLAERGMTTEARTLTRSAFEAMFFLGAVCRDESYVDRFIADDAERRGKLASALLKLEDKESRFSDDERQKLEDFLARQEASEIEARALVIAEAARHVGLMDVYNTFFRGLSNDSAHVSVVSLDRHAEATDRVVTGLKFGPEVKDVEDTIGQACTACIYLINWTREKFSIDLGEEFGRCWETYKTLIREMERNLPTAS